MSTVMEKESAHKLIDRMPQQATWDDLIAGNRKELKCNERYYVPSEISWLLKSLGYKTNDIFGAKLGAYSRNDRLTTEDY